MGPGWGLIGSDRCWMGLDRSGISSKITQAAAAGSRQISVSVSAHFGGLVVLSVQRPYVHITCPWGIHSPPKTITIAPMPMP
jgi:hypothetical protein